jgi:hypothetical protein
VYITVSVVFIVSLALLMYALSMHGQVYMVHPRVDPVQVVVARDTRAQYQYILTHWETLPDIVVFTREEGGDELMLTSLVPGDSRANDAVVCTRAAIHAQMPESYARALWGNTLHYTVPVMRLPHTVWLPYMQGWNKHTPIDVSKFRRRMQGTVDASGWAVQAVDGSSLGAYCSMYGKDAKDLRNNMLMGVYVVSQLGGVCVLNKCREKLDLHAVEEATRAKGFWINKTLTAFAALPSTYTICKWYVTAFASRKSPKRAWQELCEAAGGQSP